MGRKRIPGLYKRSGFWHIDKKVFGRRLCESTGASELVEAEKYLARRLEEIRQAAIYGVRPKRSFQDAATKFLLENQHKRSIQSDASRLKMLIKHHIGGMALDSIHMGSLQPLIDARKQSGVKMRTINHGLVIIRRILNLAASEWIDENGLTWLASAPKIKLLPEHDLREPYPLTWDEQHKLFKELPSYLEKMALFAVNTGCRDQEICKLRWDWEVKIPELPNILVFIIPGTIVKNGKDRLVVCNDAARAVAESERNHNTENVFSFRGKALTRMNATAWQNARKKAGFHVRVHDLKHTFGRRLRAAGVGFEDRQDLLGHTSGRITTHYSSAEIQDLYSAANKICEKRKNGVTLSLLRNHNLSQTNKEHLGTKATNLEPCDPSSRKNPARGFEEVN